MSKTPHVVVIHGEGGSKTVVHFNTKRVALSAAKAARTVSLVVYIFPTAFAEKFGLI